MGLDLRSSGSTVPKRSISLRAILFGMLLVYSAYMTGLRMYDLGFDDGLQVGYDAGTKQGFDRGRQEACMIKPI